MKKTEKETMEEFFMKIDLYPFMLKTVKEIYRNEELYGDFPHIEVPIHGKAMQVRHDHGSMPHNNEIQGRDL